MTRRYRAIWESSALDAEVGADGRVTIEGEVYTVTPLGEDRVEVASRGGRRVEVAIARDGRASWVSAGGRAATLTVTAVGSGKAGPATTADADMTAPMPATVVTIVAPAGTTVAKGDPVVILEAMKMTVTVRAPRPGVVTRLCCRVGEIVKAGALLAEIDA